jgi:hypothetical protein
MEAMSESDGAGVYGEREPTAMTIEIAAGC